MHVSPEVERGLDLPASFMVPPGNEYVPLLLTNICLALDKLMVSPK